MAVGDLMFLEIKILILPKSNQICPNFTKFFKKLPKKKIFQGIQLHPQLLRHWNCSNINQYLLKIALKFAEIQSIFAENSINESNQALKLRNQRLKLVLLSQLPIIRSYPQKVRL